jgi:glutamate-1-semialdehyde 2,1-aminomutase
MPLNREKSEALFHRASALLVGGVNSPVRAFKGVGGNPLFIESAQGSRVVDADGKSRIDYVLSWGPMVLGHAHPDVVAAIAAQAQKGTSFGAPCSLEVDLAEKVRAFMPNLEMMRFVSSGTEATMSALRLARGITGRDAIVKCEGCYHGHGDSLLVKAGSGVSTLGLPDSPGVPADLARLTFNVPYNDAGALAELLKEAGDQIACVILEPVAGNMGCVPPQEGYLKAIRELCDQHGVLLIFDEVMTGFRVARGGAQAHFGVKPDLTTLGKVIGGGMPVGAFGGSREHMEKLAPIGPIYQAGTLSGNPLAMAAGLATLAGLEDDAVQAGLSERTQRLATGLKEAAQDAGFAASCTHVGSMFSLFFRDTAPQNFQEVKAGDAALYARYFWGMMERGVYMAPSAFEAGFLSTAHTDSDIEETLEAARGTFADLAAG